MYLSWIVFGLITGLLAGKFTKTRLSLNNIVLGVVGAAVGGYRKPLASTGYQF